MVGLLLTALLLAVNAFFVAAEFALVSARRTQIEPRARAGSRAARVTLSAMEDISVVMAAAQLGVTVASLALGAVGEPAVAHLLAPLFRAGRVPEELLHPAAGTVALLLVVYLHVVLGEMVPKNLTLVGPDRAALVLGPALMAVVRVTRPLVVALNGVASFSLRLLGVEPRDEVSSTFTRDEVAVMMEESHGQGLLPAGDYRRLSDVLEFTGRNVGTVLLPSRQLVSVAVGTPLSEVEALCAQTGFSRFPVRGAAGEMVGYLHVKDVLEEDDTSGEAVLARKRVRPLVTLPPDERLHQAVAVMRERGAHMARVVDPAGRVLGVVTLQDVLSALVGEVRDAAQVWPVPS